MTKLRNTILHSNGIYKGDTYTFDFKGDTYTFNDGKSFTQVRTNDLIELDISKKLEEIFDNVIARINYKENILLPPETIE